MAIQIETNTKIPAGLTILIAVQFVCVVFFVTDVLADYRATAPGSGFPFHLSVEAVATLGLVAAIGVEVRFLFSLLRQKARLEHSLSTARVEVYEVIQAHFKQWKLSPSETDVATFLVKGLDIAEIAQARGCAEGTVKTHLNSIYRKSETRNRGELLSVLIDSLLFENGRA